MSEPVEDLLASERPEPAAGFRGALRRQIMERRPLRHRPANLWPVAGALGCLGGLLLIVAALLAS